MTEDQKNCNHNFGAVGQPESLGEKAMSVAITCKDCGLEAHEEWVLAGVFTNDDDMVQILDSEYSPVEL